VPSGQPCRFVLLVAVEAFRCSIRSNSAVMLHRVKIDSVLVPGELPRDHLVHAGADQVAGGGAAEVVRRPAR
jgi:hypothetical protein